MYSLNFGAQHDDLRLLKDGWLDGAGKAPSSDGLDWLRGAFECNYPDRLPLPHLYPTESGGVQAEWSIGPNEITFVVDLKTNLGDWHLLNVELDKVFERTLNCYDDGDWKWLVERIKVLTVGDV